MKTEKILLRINTDQQFQMERQAINAIETYNNLLDHCKSIEIKLPSEIAVQLVTSEMDENIVDEFVSSLFLDYPKQFAKDAREKAKEDIMEFQIYRLERSFEFVDFIKGRAVMKDDALKEIKESCSLYLTNPGAIERYKRLEIWISEGSAIWQELKPFNQLYPYLLALPATDGGYCMNVNGLNFF